MSQYRVKKLEAPVNCEVEVPGSKSITNRALLMAALSDGECRLNGVLFSDDSRHFLSCLISLGFVVEVNEIEKYVVIHGLGGDIPGKEAEINVGSAGTAARFLTAMLALSDGRYFIDASEQMKRRPMKPLFDALESMGARFEFTEREGHLPAEVTGAAYNGGVPANEVSIDISESTQFLSALMMVAPSLENGLTIHITSKKTDGSYIRITRKMMGQFGCSVEYNGNTYQIGDVQSYESKTYQIEPDVSAACYFYGAAALTGSTVIVKNVHFTSMQGDIRFIKLLEDMGCKVTDKPQGIQVTGPDGGKLSGADVDMNDFSDQAMTLAALAPFASSPTCIRNIGHIRLQESDRINAIVTELTRLGVKVEEEQDAVKIYPSEIKPAVIETYDDHRMAMAFALIGLKCDGIVIDNYECCKKTFENYFEVLEQMQSQQNG